MEKMEIEKNIFKGYYKKKKVLVTGHTGFKGSWLSLWLEILGADVAGFSKYLPSEPCHFDVIKLKEKVRDYNGDIKNIDEINNVFNEFNPEIVFHLAAQPIVRESYKNPKLTFDTNLGGTINVLECIRNSKSVKAAVMITSDKCYENIEQEKGYCEIDRLGGKDPYSASKACAEIASRAYFESFFHYENMPSIATTRAGNVIGGGDWAEDRIVPDCIRAWSNNKIAQIRKPEATRPWQHVLEPLSGYLWLGVCLLERKKDVLGEAFNFGPKDDVVRSVRELSNLFIRYWEDAKWKHIGLKDEKKEATLLRLSCKKAKERLNWESILSFEETIEMTAKWYKQYYSKETDIYNLSVSQIDDYVKKASIKKLKWSLG